MADILTDEVATFAADAEMIDKAAGYVVQPADWNEILAQLRLLNSFLHGGSVPSSVRQRLLRLGTAAGGPDIRSGTGSPEGVETAPVGTLFIRTNGTEGQALYYKQTGTGNTGWARVVGDRDIAVVAGDFAIGAGTGSAGSGAAVAIVTNYAHSTVKRGRIQLTLGTAPSAGTITITLTFPGGARTNRPFAFVRQNGGSASNQTVFWTTTTTTLVITAVLSAPSVGQTAIFDYSVED